MYLLLISKCDQKKRYMQTRYSDNTSIVICDCGDVTGFY